MREHKRIVVSAVNLVEGGTLTVLLRFLESARSTLPDEWQIIALVHEPSIVQIPGVETMAFPAVKGSWLRRMWFEYWQCRALSKTLNADFWLAMHDMTPRIQARRQAVYCHNPAPFFKVTRREAFLQPKLLAFKNLYGAMYRINMHRNHAVIVQQEWLREEFQRRYGANHVIVARPVGHDADQGATLHHRLGTVFLYPALARPFKNFELIFKAARLLEQRADWHGEIRLTLGGQENRYARALAVEYADCRSVSLIGLQPAQSMKRQYAEAHCLLFPSRRETWGLPLTEGKAHGLAILAADLPYAHESVGTYNGVAFVNVDDPAELASKMLAFQDGTLVFTPHNPPTPAEPYAPNWSALVRMLTDGL